MDGDIIYKIATWILPILLAITLHEYAHGWAAHKLGDNTAKMLGRLTINPIKHIDPVGTLLIPGLLLLVSAPFLFGYAKPVPVNARNLKNPRKDMALVAIAGPLANLIMAFAWGLIILLGMNLISDPSIAKGIVQMSYNGILINVVLMVLNLLPLPPLDGGRVLAGIVPRNTANMLDKIEPYGFFILIGLLMIGALDYILAPLISPITSFILSIFIGA
jgi:Zn-dependent protease